MTVADRAISNAFVLVRELYVAQPKHDPENTSARIARASREVQSDAQRREDARV